MTSIPKRVSLLLLSGWMLALAWGSTGCASTAPTEAASSDTTAAATAEAPPPPPVPRTVPLTVTRATPVSPLDTVQAGRFDLGKMWTFEDPPLDYLEEAYGFRPDEAWFERARLGALRIPGCTASFVSPRGLIMTNHHCARGYIAQVSRPGEDLLVRGFYAETLGQERPVEGLYAEQLIEIVPVTAEIEAALGGAQTDAERAQARADAVEDIEARLIEEYGGEEDIVVEVISLYQGGRYSAYVFRRYEDVRLVMAPERQIAHYGGEWDNFTFPRYALDMTFLRAYDDAGEPLGVPHSYSWSERGAAEGDVVFVVGNPGATNRLETVAQLEFRRDVGEKAVLTFVDNRVAAYRAYAEEGELADELQNRLFSLLNAQKAYTGRLEGLRDPVLMARRRDVERQLVEAIEEDPELRSEYGGLVEEIAGVQQERRQLAAEYGAFLGLPASSYASATLRRALLAYRYLQQERGGASPAQLEDLRQQILAVEDNPRGLERQLLAARFREVQAYFGAESMLAKEVLMDRDPLAQAAFVLERTVFSDSLSTAQALAEGGLETSEDQALLIASYLVPRFEQFQQARAGLEARQQEALGRLGGARYAIYGVDVPPDATFSLRIADGVVRGYPYNGTVAPPLTTFYGLFDRYYAYPPEFEEWDLPERWRSLPETFELETPVNLVSTNDIIGGNSGSPLLNRDLEIVGLVFDGNIESLPGAYIYDDARARTVSVDARGILESLDDAYDADRLVLELTTGRLVETETDADAVSASRP